MKKRISSLHLLMGLLCVVMLVINGCSHSLEIVNLSSYRGSGITNFEKPISIGITSNAVEQEEKILIDGVAEGLKSPTTKVIMPYFNNSKQPVDVVANVDIKSVHEGSGWNFWINFPGFLIWTPAWHGYEYEIKYTIDCTLTKGGSKETISQFVIPIALDIRHAAIDRTWTEISWFEAGIIAFISGFVFMSYDDDVTPLVSEKIESPLGKYVAREIIKNIESRGALSELLLPNGLSGFYSSHCLGVPVFSRNSNTLPATIACYNLASNI